MSNTKPALWKHQETAIQFAQTHSSFALFFEPGTGKTRTVIEILRNIYNEKRSIQPTLIFAPKSVCPQWKTEFAKFSAIDQKRIEVFLQTGAKRVQRFNEMRLKYNGNFIAVMNYEAVGITEFYNVVKAWTPELLVLDESHRCKNGTSVRFKKILPIALAASRRFLLTGTPVLKNPLDLFAQYRLMNQTIFGTNFFAYRATYFYDKNAGMPKMKYFPDWVIRQGATDAIAQAIQSTALQAKKSECLDLPPLISVRVEVGMDKAQQRAYDEMKADFITFVRTKRDEVVASVAEFAMTKTIRLQQILAGFIKTEDGQEVWLPGCPRLEALRDLLSDLAEAGQKIIIWTIFIPTYPIIHRVCAELGLESAEIIGGQTNNAREKELASFRTGTAQVIVANPAAGGTGINDLVQAASAIYYTRGYRLGDYIQTQARNYRGGSEMHAKVTHYHLVTPDSLDDVILKALETKQSVADAVLAWAK